MTAPITPETIVYDLKSVASPRISPDAATVIFALAEPERGSAKGKSQLWSQDLASGERRQLTFSGRNWLPRWSHHSDQLAFLSDRNGGTGIFVLPFAGGEAEEITNHASAGGITEFSWSPHGGAIAYAASFDPENPDEEERDADAAPKVRVSRRADYKQDMRGFLNNNRSQIWIVDVKTRERRRVTTEAVDYTDPAWSPDGKQLVFKIASRAGLFNQLGLLDVASGDLTVIGDPDGTAGTWAWSPDGTQLLIAGEPELRFQPNFYLYTVATGERKWLTTDLPCVPEAGAPIFTPPARPYWREPNRALFHGIERARSGIYALTIDTGAVERLISWDAVHTGFHVDGEGTTAVQSQVSFDSAGELVVVDLLAGTSRQITDYNAAQLAETPPARWEAFEFERDGFTVEAFLLHPAGYEEGERYPLVLDVHGGPAGFYGPKLDAIQQSLAAAGNFVLLVNPRGSTTYGGAFAIANLHDWGGGDYEDLMMAVDQATARPDIDPDRLGVYGYSYGGFMSSWIVGHTDRFKTAVIGAPVVDLVSMYGTSDISYSFLPLYIGGTPVTNHDRYLALSPLSHLHNARTPTLILHGEADERCPIGQGEQLYVALQDAGVETEFARYPDGGHLFPWMGAIEHRVDFATRAVNWFERFLNDAVPSSPS